MAIYTYKGLNNTGKEVKSSINADGLVQAKQKIRSMGIMLIDIKEQKSKVTKKKDAITFGGGVNINEISMMTRQLATLVKARIQIVEALAALMDQTESAQLRIILSEVRQKVNEGTSLAKALGDYPKVFNNIYINMVDAGETSGTLSVVLLRLAEFTEAQVKLKNKIKGALTYPAIMSIVGCIMISIIFLFVIPKITKIFISMKKTLPLQTRISIWISNFFQDYWWAMLIAAVLSYVIFIKYIHSKKGRERWDRLLLRLPVVGKLITMINVSRFCSTLATLLHSSVPILTSMKIVSNLISNVHMQHAVEESRISVSEGSSIAGPLVKSELFPPLVTHMITLGEKSGELEPMLQIIAENYEDQVESKLNGLTSILEPIMIIVMAVVVAFVVFSVVVPMMEINTLAK